METWHRITDVDTEALTGTCSQCGSTRVRMVTVNKATGRTRYRCRTSNVRTNMTREARRRGVVTENYESDFKRLSADQGNCCAICQEPLAKRAALDHCHETGRVRGVLCFHCNVGIGHLKDNVQNLERAIKYLG